MGSTKLTERELRRGFKIKIKGSETKIRKDF